MVAPQASGAGTYLLSNQCVIVINVYIVIGSPLLLCSIIAYIAYGVDHTNYVACWPLLLIFRNVQFCIVFCFRIQQYKMTKSSQVSFI